tara:strand:+ start:990 stop:1559 length:570 start_codon:yes stop_codon:yes gene_type:complete
MFSLSKPSKTNSLKVLQQHLSYFDPDSDGIIWPLDTFTGFHALGYGILLSLLSVLVIHLNFSYPTLPPGHYLPDPFFRIYIARIHKDKHGSDSGTYDTEGRFVPQKFEDIFAKYAGGDKKGITMGEVWTYMKGQRLYGDPIGWGAAGFECEYSISSISGIDSCCDGSADWSRDCDLDLAMAGRWEDEKG